MRHTTRESERDEVGGHLLGLVAHLVGRAPHHHAGRGREPPSPPVVLHRLLDVEVEGPVDLEHHDPSVGQPPLAVGPPAAPGPVRPRDLAIRHRHAEPATHPTHVDLGPGVRTAGDVAQGALERLRPAQRAQGVHPLHHALGGGEPLLDAGGDHTVRGSWGGLVGGEEEDRRLEATGREPWARVAEQLERPATAEEPNPVHRLEAQLVVDVDRHDVTVPAGQAVAVRRTQAAEHAALSGMQHRQPLELRAGQLAGHGADHARGPLHPTPGRAMVPHPVPVDAVPVQLSAGNHSLLCRDECLEDVVHD